jgi:hypothetical protein
MTRRARTPAMAMPMIWPRESEEEARVAGKAVPLGAALDSEEEGEEEREEEEVGSAEDGDEDEGGTLVDETMELDSEVGLDTEESAEVVELDAGVSEGVVAVVAGEVSPPYTQSVPRGILGP